MSRPPSRTHVKLWHFLCDVSMGGLILAALLVLAAGLALLMWGLFAGPPPLAWPLRGAVALLTLWAVGRGWTRREFGEGRW